MASDTKETWDFFVCHILQDREIARTLADALNAKGLRVWYADYSLKVGDPLMALTGLWVVAFAHGNRDC